MHAKLTVLSYCYSFSRRSKCSVLLSGLQLKTTLESLHAQWLYIVFTLMLLFTVTVKLRISSIGLSLCVLHHVWIVAVVTALQFIPSLKIFQSWCRWRADSMPVIITSADITFQGFSHSFIQVYVHTNEPNLATFSLFSSQHTTFSACLAARIRTKRNV